MIFGVEGAEKVSKPKIGFLVFFGQQKSYKMSGNDAEKNKDANQILEQSLTKLAWLVNINAKDLAKKHEKEEKGRSVN